MNYAFISGFYKSGTSWLLNVLAHHPHVLGLREHDIMYKIRRFFPDRELIIKTFFEEQTWGFTDPARQYRAAGFLEQHFDRPNHSGDLPQETIDRLLTAMH